LILYGTIAWYFAGVMVRLMLTLAPIACILGAIGISGVLNAFCAHVKKSWGAVKAALTGDDDSDKTDDGSSSGAILPAVISLVVTVTLGFLTIWYAMHASFVASEAYSSPSIVLGEGIASVVMRWLRGSCQSFFCVLSCAATSRPDGSRAIMDDFREAYYWLRHNTHPDAKIMSWWDYGYQISGMANRTVLVDNNTWNNTHIATVGTAASPRMHARVSTRVLVMDVCFCRSRDGIH
jgi:dolichyl-diphosphooligosaccharide---protein glycosyltransferase